MSQRSSWEQPKHSDRYPGRVWVAAKWAPLLVNEEGEHENASVQLAQPCRSQENRITKNNLSFDPSRLSLTFELESRRVETLIKIPYQSHEFQIYGEKMIPSQSEICGEKIDSESDSTALMRVWCRSRHWVTVCGWDYESLAWRSPILANAYAHWQSLTSMIMILAYRHRTRCLRSLVTVRTLPYRRMRLHAGGWDACSRTVVDIKAATNPCLLQTTIRRSVRRPDLFHSLTQSPAHIHIHLYNF